MARHLVPTVRLDTLLPSLVLVSVQSVQLARLLVSEARLAIILMEISILMLAQSPTLARLRRPSVPLVVVVKKMTLVVETAIASGGQCEAARSGLRWIAAQAQ